MNGYACVMPGPPPPVGRILAADADVYVASVGAENGMRVGMQLEVWREGAFVGTIELTEVKRSLSAGRLSGTGGSEVRPGRHDAIRTIR